LKERGCAVVIASHEKTAAHKLAQEVGCRYVQFEALYSTHHDVLIVCATEKAPGHSRAGDGGVHPGYLKRGMTVLDARPDVGKSPLATEAAQRGCSVVGPPQLWLEQAAMQARLLTGKDVPRQLLADAAPWIMEEE